MESLVVFGGVAGVTNVVTTPSRAPMDMLTTSRGEVIDRPR